MADEYELLPAEELESLREEVNILKANSFGNTEEAKTLLEGIQQLNDNINRMIKVFSDIDQELVAEYNKVKSVDEQYHELQEQNKKIASGILTVANLVEDIKSNGSEDGADVPDFNDVPPPPTPEPDAPSQNPNDTINFNPSAPGQTPPPLTTGQVPGFGNPATQSSSPSNSDFDDPFANHSPRAPPIDPWAPKPSGSAPPPMPGEQSAMPNAVPPHLNAGQQAPPPPSGSSPPLPTQSSSNGDPFTKVTLPNAQTPPSPASGATPSPPKNQFTPPPDPFAGSGLSTPPEPPKKKGLFGLFS